VSTAAIKKVLSPQFKNILFATDFSPCSEMALACVQAIAQRSGSTVHLVHVIDPETSAGPLGMPYEHIEDRKTVAQRALKRLVQSEVLKGVNCTQTVESGEVCEVVCRLAAEAKVDAIVLGTHGRGGLKHLVLGSVAEQIFRRATCPVLTVGPEAHAGPFTGKLKSIVYATDFSPASRAALPYAVSLARAEGAKLILVHGVRNFPGDEECSAMHVDEMVASATRELHNMLSQYGEMACEAVAKFMPAVELILEVAAENQADLIVMGAHAGTSSHIPWAVAHRVVCHARCPVLTVRG
jgi:nucleotide-binding universal stress UspA family protein